MMLHTGEEYVWLVDEENRQFICKWHIMEAALQGLYQMHGISWVCKMKKSRIEKRE